MDPILKAFLLSWDWRVDVIVILLLAGAMYGRGWRRLRGLRKRRDTSAGRLSEGWRLTAYLAGLGFLALALLSPVDVQSGTFFAMHMIQHLLLNMIAPALLVVADPLPRLMWGLPTRLRRPAGRILSRKSRFRWILSNLGPGLVWMIFVAVFLAWHDRRAYEAALQSSLIHDLEHLSFFATGLLYWWFVIGAGPRLHKRPQAGVRIGFLLATVPVTMIVGIAFTFAQEPFYPYYLAVARPWGVTALEDQIIGGTIVWIAGSMMLMLAALILTAQLFQTEEKKARAAAAKWGLDETIVAPVWKA